MDTGKHRLFPFSFFSRFAKGNRPGNGSGFDIDSGDLLEMEKCHGVVVASAIFGNYKLPLSFRHFLSDGRKN